MRAFQPLRSLIRHLPPSQFRLSRSSLPRPFLFYRANVTRLSVTQANRVLHPSQTRNISTATSLEGSLNSDSSTQNPEDTSTLKGFKAAVSLESENDSSLVTPEALHSRQPKSPHPNLEFHDPRKKPAYRLRFTCKPCGVRSGHYISKQGYHNGTVLITCPHCKNRHIISDHLKIFSDVSITIEDILQQKGETLKRGTIDKRGDIEFSPDPNEVPHILDLSEKEKIERLLKAFNLSTEKLDAKL